jgi:hypothetical protein
MRQKDEVEEKRRGGLRVICKRRQPDKSEYSRAPINLTTSCLVHKAANEQNNTSRMEWWKERSASRL